MVDTVLRAKLFVQPYVYSKTRKPNYIHSGNCLSRGNEAVTLTMTSTALSMSLIVKKATNSVIHSHPSYQSGFKRYCFIYTAPLG